MKILSLVFTTCVLLQCVSGTYLNRTYAVNEDPKWDLCILGGDIFSCSGHGMCSGPGGQCVCTDGYTGRDCSIPPGGFPYAIPKASVTQFCQLETGGCAPGMCVGGGSFDHTNLPKGVDGVAAVNPTLFGSRYAYAKTAGAGVPLTVNGMYSFVGQSCGTCWKLTRKAISIVVAVVDRCAGYCRATLPPDQICTASSEQAGKECGECIHQGKASIPQCSCLSRASIDNKGWCNGYPNAHCDWCAANDHPHFDLDITAQMKICDEAGADGFCHLDSFQLVSCPDFLGPWPNGFPNGTGAPATSDKPYSSSSNSNSEYCSFTTGDGECKSIKATELTCNGCNLTMCNHGQLWNLGCPRGTSCKDSVCQIGVPCDPVVTSCTPAATQSPSSSTKAPANPTTAPPKPPPAEGTTKPINPTKAPTQAPATQAPTKAATPATQAPATPATQAPATQAPVQPTKAPTQPPATPATSKPCTRGALTKEEEEQEGILAQARAVEQYRIDRQEAIRAAIEQQKNEL